MLETLPPTDTHQKQRLELMALLGPALLGLYGPGAQITQDLYANAVALARELPDWGEHFPIFWGWWRLSHLRDFSGRIFQGWAMAMQEDARKGARLADEALASERDVNTADDFAVFHCLVAEAWVAAGEPERALADLVSARAGFEHIGLHHWLPEVWRMIGDLTIALDPKNLTGAARAYVKARRLAERQGAHRLALRATVRLERLAWPSRLHSIERLPRARARVSELDETANELGILSSFSAVEN